MDRAIASRALATGHSRRGRRASWAGTAIRVLTAACLGGLRWGIASLGRVSGCPVCSTPLAAGFHCAVKCDARDAGFGAVTFVEGLAAAFSTLLAALLARGPASSAFGPCCLGSVSVWRRLWHPTWRR